MVPERAILIPPPTPLAQVIESVGTDRFGQLLTAFICAEARVDYCSAFRIGAQSLSAVSLFAPDDRSSIEHVWAYVYGEFWRKDPALVDARARLGVAGHAAVRMGAEVDLDRDLRRSVYPDLVDRLLLCGIQQDATYGVSLLRWAPSVPYTEEEVARLTSISAVLLALVGRHAQAQSMKRCPADALGAVAEAERCLLDLTKLPVREREVCARTIFGLSAGEIGTALGISAETVKCYRKRAYGRLDVTSERELLVRYLKLWDEWKRDACGLDSPRSPMDMNCLPMSARLFVN